MEGNAVKNSVMMGVAIVLFSAIMGFSGQARAQFSPLGYCGPENEGEVKSRSFYYSNGMLKQYYEFTCYSGQWENTLFWSCDTRGYCTNLS